MEGNSKITRYLGTLLFVAAMTFMIGFWWARSTGASDATSLFMMKGLAYTLYTMTACAAFMAIVGAYHTVLALLGLDGEPGLLSGGERTGPLSGATDPRASDGVAAGTTEDSSVG
jgi:hypothetical protein